MWLNPFVAMYDDPRGNAESDSRDDSQFVRVERIEAPAPARFTKSTRRTRFLNEMNRVVPWERICRIVRGHYPAGTGAGRPPVGVDRMPRIYFLQHWYDLSEPAIEVALHDIPSLREFVGVDLDRERVPDETTVCNFRHLLENTDSDSASSRP